MVVAHGRGSLLRRTHGRIVRISRWNIDAQAERAFPPVYGEGPWLNPCTVPLGSPTTRPRRSSGSSGRAPNHLELAMYAVMWSEHCSYKSSQDAPRAASPPTAPWVLVGPGENAGVVDVGDGIAAAIRIESHNHPSAIEPYQGAATGVGGILRDIFTMGARPIALMDPLRFGPLDDARSRWIAEGVVRGISGYGNAVGRAHRGRRGHVRRDLCRQSAGERAVPRRAADRAARARAGQWRRQPGRAAGLVDGPRRHRRRERAGLGRLRRRRGRRGQAAQRAGGRPLRGEAADRGVPGPARRRPGRRASRTSAAPGSPAPPARRRRAAASGMDVWVSEVARARAGHGALRGDDAARARSGCWPSSRPRRSTRCWPSAPRWEVRASVVGRGHRGRPAAHPRPARRRGAGRRARGHPPRGRPALRPAAGAAPTARPSATRATLPAPADAAAWAADLLALLADTSLGVGAVRPPAVPQHRRRARAATPAVLRLKHPTTGLDTGRGLALTTDGNHRWCAVDPRAGHRPAGGRGGAQPGLRRAPARWPWSNCLNFGNPEHPEVMWQLSEAIDGMAEACRGPRRARRRRQRQPLQREPRAATSTPRRSSACWGWSTASTRRPARPALVEGGRLVLVGAEPEPATWRVALGLRRAALAAGACGRADLAASPPWPRVVRGAGGRRAAGRRPRRGRGRPGRLPGRDGRGRRRRAATWACPPTPTRCSGSPRAPSCCAWPPAAAGRGGAAGRRRRRRAAPAGHRAAGPRCA